ncbi:hypothetical protein [Micromonospora aurantiaca (nom. illeg.)]|uniref:hypothetical protein n=1 Tax=Micromonospora aurantiaca (nom. illeg.) TaxID=47850 RepID=UPI003F49DC1C
MSNPKNPEDRQRRNLPAILDGSGRTSDVPRPPAGLTAALRRDWADLWTSPVAALLDPVSDLPAVSRLYELRQLGDRLGRQVRKPGDVDTGLVMARVRVATEVRLIEAALGLSPRSRLALGLALLAGRRGAGDSGGGEREHDDADD